MHAELIEESAELWRFRGGIEQQQNASLFIPEIAEQLHLAIREVVLRADDHDRFHIGRDRLYVE